MKILMNKHLIKKIYIYDVSEMNESWFKMEKILPKKNFNTKVIKELNEKIIKNNQF